MIVLTVWYACVSLGTQSNVLNVATSSVLNAFPNGFKEISKHQCHLEDVLIDVKKQWHQ